jgi:hypothetical protein
MVVAFLITKQSNIKYYRFSWDFENDGAFKHCWDNG